MRDDDWKLVPKEFVSKNQMTDKELKELIEKIDREKETVPLSPEEKIIYTDKNGKRIGVTIEKMDRRKQQSKKLKRKTCRCK